MMSQRRPARVTTIGDALTTPFSLSVLTATKGHASKTIIAGANDRPGGAAAPSRAMREGPERCPCCGQTYPESRICAPFVLTKSQLLDMVTLAQDVLRDLQAALEQEVL